MKSIRRFPLALVGLAVLLLTTAARPACGQDVTGTWALSVNLGSGGTGGVTLELMQEGASVRGTYSGSYGRGVPLTGTAENGSIALSFTTENIGEVVYEGSVAADTMWGSVTYGTSFDGTYEAYRRPPATIVSTIVGYTVLGLVLAVAVGGMVWAVRR